MENKINIAELLKDCPKGMELDCTIWDDVIFDHVDTSRDYPIYIRKKDGTTEFLTKNGEWNFDLGAKCVIFPKGKTTWEGFHRPFMDGDIIYVCDEHSDATFTYVAILKHIEKGGKIICHCFYNYEEDFFNGTNDFLYDGYNTRFATEEEKEELFKVIKDNGYKWNAETKTLEKLVEPQFKVGDRIKYKNGKNIDGVEQGVILSITDDTYDVAVTNDMGIFVPIVDQDKWELVPNKFDVTTLKPFESRVLVRDYDTDVWKVSFWGCLINSVYSFNYDTIRGGYKQCIPYEGNEHLLGKTDDCIAFYKTWK